MLPISIAREKVTVGNSRVSPTTFARAVFVASISTFLLQGCDRSVSDDYKEYMCREAEDGAAFRCNYLGVKEDTCADIAREAFRLCYESMPEEYAR